jgi:hypothetical protein
MEAAAAMRGARARSAPGVPAGDFRSALEGALAAADSDERIGPLIRATRMRMRFVFSDTGMTLDVAAVEDGERNLRWVFDAEPEVPARLELTMDSGVANRYLQGSESLAIGIAHRKVRVRGDSRVALLYIPAARLLCDPYRRVVDEQFPRLATT